MGLLSKILLPLLTLLGGGLISYFTGKSSGKNSEKELQLKQKEQEIKEIEKNTYENVKINQKADSLSFDDSADLLFSSKKRKRNPDKNS